MVVWLKYASLISSGRSKMAATRLFKMFIIYHLKLFWRYLVHHTLTKVGSLEISDIPKLTCYLKLIKFNMAAAQDNVERLKSQVYHLHVELACK